MMEQDRVGQQLGNYVLVSRLGKGGFSEVYLAEHIYLKTQAAIKVLSVRLLESEQKAFFDEARIVAHLQHPHIVRVLDFGVIDRVPFLVMEYAPNGTLRGRHPKGVAVPLETVLPYVEQVADALQYAHDQQLVHRDVKPGNMLVGKKDEILLSDFGTALAFDSSITVKRDDMMVGTPAYTAPEQLQGNATFASDQYALGMVAYEWLTGNRPFRGTFEEVARLHLHAPPPSLRAQVPDIPVSVERVILKALEKRPEQRYGSVREFAAALKDACVLDEPATIVLSPGRGAPPVLPIATTFPSMPPSSPEGAIDHPVSLPALAPARRGPSRRVVIGGLAGLIVIGAGGSLAWFALTPKSPLSALANHNSQVLSQAPANLVYRYKGHSGSVNSVAWSPDSTRIASGSVDHTVRVWNANDGLNAFTYTGHSAPVRHVAWEPKSGARIASAGRDKTVQVWKSAGGARVSTFRGRSSVITWASWSPDASLIASVDYAVIHIWASASAQPTATYRGNAGRVNAVAWSPNGKFVAAGDASNEVLLWDMASGKNVFTYREHGDEVKDVAWSPDGTLIASASLDHTVRVWQAATGQTLVVYAQHTDQVNAIAWSPDGTYIVSASSDRTAQVWEATTGTKISTYQGHSDFVNSVDWSPNGALIASGSSDHTVQVWRPVL